MKLLFDEHFSDALAQAVKRKRPAVTVDSIHGRSLDGLVDPALLELLDLENTVLVTRDVRTVPGALAARLSAGQTHGGVIFVPRSIRQSDDKELLRRLLALIDEKGGADWQCREEWL